MGTGSQLLLSQESRKNLEDVSIRCLLGHGVQPASSLGTHRHHLDVPFRNTARFDVGSLGHEFLEALLREGLLLTRVFLRRGSRRSHERLHVHGQSAMSRWRWSRFSTGNKIGNDGKVPTCFNVHHENTSLPMLVPPTVFPQRILQNYRPVVFMTTAESQTE